MENEVFHFESMLGDPIYAVYGHFSSEDFRQMVLAQYPDMSSDDIPDGAVTQGYCLDTPDWWEFCEAHKHGAVPVTFIWY